MKLGILVIIFLSIFVVILLFSIKSTKTKTPENTHKGSKLPKCVYPNSSQKDLNMRNWKWVPECKTNVNFIIESEWPTYLTYEAWDSCQGCKSAGSGTDSTGDSFQVVGDWMRISQRNGGDVSLVSGASSKKHWFNPPRNNTNDKPLEIEWYMYMDASNWGNSEKEIIESGLTDSNWSAFWSFGHGAEKSGWPNGGEWDISEWLPTFGGPKDGKGCATGLHNSNSGAFPPCCLKRDGIMYPKKGKIAADKAKNNSGLLWPNFDKGDTFRTWGYLLNKNKDPNWNKDYYTSDAITYNKVLHCFLRCTNKQLTIWVKENADPTNPPKLNIEDYMSNDDVNKIFQKSNYVCVGNNYADFGSNRDMTFVNAFPDKAGQEGKSNKPTNWHQNMFFVWSVILSHNGNRLSRDRDGSQFYRPLSFYLSDIHLRGGGNYEKSMAPEGVIDPELIRLATETTDHTSTESCQWLDNGSKYPNVCDNRLQRYANNQFKKCQN